MTRRIGAVLLSLLVACGGGDKKEKTTPDKKTDGQSMKETGDPEAPPAGGTGTGGTAGGGSADPGAGSAGSPNSGGVASEPGEATPQVTYPNLDPDTAQAKTQVDAHLAIAKNALSQPTPDCDTALKEGRIALTYDAASVDAGAMVAFAYYHKKLYETAELVLDDLFKRDAAKNNAQVYYVYGLVYDKTNRPDRAQLAYQKAVGLDPNHASAMVNLGVHYLQNGRYDGVRVDLGLMISNDGVHFREPVPGHKVIPRGQEGEWDDVAILQGDAFVNEGEQTMIWYSHWDTGGVLENMDIGLATLRRDGFGSLSAKVAENDAHFITSTFTAREISLNVEGVTAELPLRLQLLDHLDRPLAGFEVVVTTNGVQVPVKWPKALPGQKMALRVNYPAGSQARVYAIYLD